MNEQLNVTIKSYGILQFRFNVICSHICRYQFIGMLLVFFFGFLILNRCRCDWRNEDILCDISH